MRTAFFGVLLMLALSASRTEAASWGSVPSGCTPNPADISVWSNDSAAYRAGVMFYMNTTGSIRLYCSVQFSGGLTPPNTLSLVYRDSYAITANNIDVRYFKMDKLTGTSTLIADLDTSKTITCGVATTARLCSVGFIDTVNTSAYTYYVTIQLNRTTSAADESAYVVGLAP